MYVSCPAGNPPSACDMARDKAATRRMMAAAGLPSPKYTTIAGTLARRERQAGGGALCCGQDMFAVRIGG